MLRSMLDRILNVNSSTNDERTVRISNFNCEVKAEEGKINRLNCNEMEGGNNQKLRHG